MRTDKEIFEVFQQCPEIVFQMTGLEYPGPCKVASVTLKALERRLDGLVIPDDDEKALTVFEVQFQKCPEFYPRAAGEMALVQQENGMRRIQGCIFFAARSLDPGTEP